MSFRHQASPDFESRKKNVFLAQFLALALERVRRG